MRALRLNTNGPDVKRWQAFLNEQGFSAGTADGSFGEQTRLATVSFQQEHGLDPDGVVGGGTQEVAANLGFNAQAESNAGGGGSGGGVVVAGGDAGGASIVTDEVLSRIMPHTPAAKRAQYLPFLQQAMAEFEINNRTRAAAFLAQLAHESGELRFMEEIWGPTAAQRRYEPVTSLSRGLGNTQSGDGFRFKGRGPIQITGRSNYARYGQMLDLDLVGDPAQAATPQVGFRTAALYWRKNGLNELADQQAFVTITKRINGGTNGLAERQRYYAVAKQVLGVGSTRGLRRDTGDDSDLPRFDRGLDGAGEITPTAAERNAAVAAVSDAPNDSGVTRSIARPATTKNTSQRDSTNRAVKSATKRPAATKRVARKTTVGKSTVVSGKAAAKKSMKAGGGNTAKGAKNISAKKHVAKKQTAKKSVAKKQTAKKSVAKKQVTKKNIAKVSATKRVTKGGARKR